MEWSLDDRLRALEQRVADLEERLEPDSAVGAEGSATPSPTADHRTMLTLRVDGKKFTPGEYGDDRVDLDLTLTLSPDRRATRAVKGSLVFTDLFGDVGFRIGYTVNDPLLPGVPLAIKNVGFDFNQFMSEHNWMLGTDLDDMTYRFEVDSVIYQDGSREDY
jgi:hypothetical protein